MEEGRRVYKKKKKKAKRRGRGAMRRVPWAGKGGLPHLKKTKKAFFLFGVGPRIVKGGGKKNVGRVRVTKERKPVVVVWAQRGKGGGG